MVAQLRTTRLATPSSFTVTTPAPRREWRELLDADPYALTTQTPEWLDAMTSNRRFVDASRLYALADGRRFVVPLAAPRALASRVVGAASNLDAWGAGGIVGPSIDTGAVASILDDLATAYGRLRVRPNPLQAALYRAGVPRRAFTVARRAHALELPGDAAVAWEERFTSACRRSVRKAERSGVEVELDTTGRLAPVFHELLMQSVDRWAGQQHEPRALARWRAARRDPVEKWATIARSLPGTCQFWVARHDGAAVAAIVVLRGANAHYTRGAMNKEAAGPLRANHLLMWRAIQDAIESGCRQFHMGETGASTSLARYKEQFGAVAYDYADYVLERLPLSRIDAASRRIVKRAIRFRDVA